VVKYFTVKTVGMWKVRNHEIAREIEMPEQETK
jgi:hypothetical protein